MGTTARIVRRGRPPLPWRRGGGAGGPVGVAAADEDGLRFESHSVFRLDPAADVVRVTIDVVVTHESAVERVDLLLLPGGRALGPYRGGRAPGGRGRRPAVGRGQRAHRVPMVEPGRGRPGPRPAVRTDPPAAAVLCHPEPSATHRRAVAAQRRVRHLRRLRPGRPGTRGSRGRGAGGSGGRRRRRGDAAVRPGVRDRLRGDGDRRPAALGTRG